MAPEPSPAAGRAQPDVQDDHEKHVSRSSLHQVHKTLAATSLAHRDMRYVQSRLLSGLKNQF